VTEINLVKSHAEIGLNGYIQKLCYCELIVLRKADLLPRTRLLTRFLLARSRATLIGNIRAASGGEMGRERLSGTDVQKLEVRMRFGRVLPAEAQALAREDHTTLSAWIRNLAVREVKARKRDDDSKVNGTPEAGQPRPDRRPAKP